jgi:hypothetical protein
MANIAVLPQTAEIEEEIFLWPNHIVMKDSIHRGITL